MTNQNDFVIDNGTGLAVRQDIQDALQALAGLSSGDSAPSTTYAFQLYANTTSGMLQIRNAANSAFIDLIQLDGTFTLEDGSASTPALAFRDDLNTGIFSSAADTFNVATGGVERMELGATTIFNESGANVDFRIEGDSEANLFYVDAGNNRVGVGTSSPAYPLTVNSDTSGQGLAIYGRSADDIGELAFFENDGTTKLGELQYRQDHVNFRHRVGHIAFATGGTTERARIDSSGRLLINRTSAFSTGASGTESAKLQVGINSSSGTAVGFADTGGFDTNVMVMNHARAGANNGAFTGVMIQFRNKDNTSVGGISSGASTTTFSTNSDYRLKENEVLISDGITRLKQLKPYKFNFKTTPTITQEGFFAHEAQAVVPQAVTGTKDGMRPETYYLEGDTLPSGKVVGDVKTYSSSEIDIQQLDYSQLVPLLVAAVQELIGKVQALEAA